MAGPTQSVTATAAALATTIATSALSTPTGVLTAILAMRVASGTIKASVTAVTGTGATWVLANTVTGSTTLFQAMYYGYGASLGQPVTMTVTGTTIAGIALEVDEWPNIYTGTPYGVLDCSLGTVTRTYTSTATVTISYAPVNAQTVMVAGATCLSTDAFTAWPGENWTTLQTSLTGGTVSLATAYQLVSPSSTQQVSGTHTSSAACIGLVCLAESMNPVIALQEGTFFQTSVSPPLTLTLPNAPQQGNQVVLYASEFVNTHGSGGVPNISGITEAGVSWQLGVLVNPGYATFNVGEIWAGTVTSSSASPSLTIAFNNSANLFGWVGVGTELYAPNGWGTSLVDQSATNSNASGSSTAVTTGVITPSVANAVCCAILMSNNNDAYTLTSAQWASFAQPSGHPSDQGAAWTVQTGGAQAQQGTWTLSAGDSWLAGIVDFALASGVVIVSGPYIPFRTLQGVGI